MNDGVARASLSPHDESAEADLRAANFAIGTHALP
jgi:hypothetical protein